MVPSHLYCVKAKQRYEREERRKELKRLRGEDTWMLPEVDQRLQEIEEVRFRVVFVITLHYLQLSLLNPSVDVTFSKHW